MQVFLILNAGVSIRKIKKYNNLIPEMTLLSFEHSFLSNIIYQKLFIKNHLLKTSIKSHPSKIIYQKLFIKTYPSKLIYQKSSNKS